MFSFLLLFEEFSCEVITTGYCFRSSCLFEVSITEPFKGVCASHLQLLDMKIFVDTDSDIRLVRRLRRDITERGRDIEGVIKQYNKFVKPAFEQYIEPTMRLADIVVPRGEAARRGLCGVFDYFLTPMTGHIYMFSIGFPPRWWEYGCHRSDSPTCS